MTQQAKPINPYIEGFKAGRKDGEEIRAELLAELHSALFAMSTVEQTTEIAAAKLRARAVMAKAERRGYDAIKQRREAIAKAERK